MKVDVLDIAKRRGFFWSAFEIYGGMSGFYTYGPLGALLKLRIEQLIRDYYVNQEACLLLEAPILTSKDPWVASGHIDNFTDITCECQKCGEPYRADHLVEERTGKSVEGLSLSEIHNLIVKNKIKCPKCSGKLGNVYDYNLMFRTFIGPGKTKTVGYLRPETAQTTYMPFKRLFEIGRKKLPFGVIQMGKSFRNEISPRKGLVRLREFSQAEIQFFVDPKQKNTWTKFNQIENIKVLTLTKTDQKRDLKPKRIAIKSLATKKIANKMIVYFLARSLELYSKMGIDMKKIRCRQHKDEERCFYSADTWDIEFMSDSFGRIELVGIADRTDYDLKRHTELSKEDMKINVGGKKIIPHIMEVAYGIDRPLFCILESCLRQAKDRVWFVFPPIISPYQAAIFPLVSRDKLPEKAKDVYNLLLREGFYALYDEGFIGKLYYRQDEAGTPYCMTIDYDTLKDESVTIRNRDDKKQIRVKIKELPGTLRALIASQVKFELAGKKIK